MNQVFREPLPEFGVLDRRKSLLDCLCKVLDESQLVVRRIPEAKRCLHDAQT